MDTIFAMSGTVLYTALAAWHFKASCWRWNSYPHRLSLRLSIIQLILGFISIAVLHLFTFSHSQTLCQSVLRYISFSPYMAFKTVTYLILIHRRHLIFDGHERFHQPNRLRICGVLVSWWSMLNIVWLRFATHIPPHCSMQTPEIDTGCLISVVLCDLSAFVVVACLYMVPYQQLKHGADEHSQRLFKVNKKHCILSISAVFCICVTILFVAAFAMVAMWLTLNILVSSLAIILMFEWNDTLAGKVCSCCYTPVEQLVSTGACPGNTAMVPSQAASVTVFDVHHHHQYHEDADNPVVEISVLGSHERDMY